VSNELFEIRKSAIDGTGCFALKKIEKGTPVVEYVGEKISKAESLKRCENQNHYIFTLDDEFDLDGDVDWNPAKFINHSCDPNCEAEFFGEMIWIMAIRDIEPGEEITFNYSYDLEDYKEHPCRCGSPNCVGYIVAEEFFPKFRPDSVAQNQS
jgi:SET domain-containing protein